MNEGLATINISWGELFDKFSILRLKTENIEDPEKRHYVDIEINYLETVIESAGLKDVLTSRSYLELHKTNSELWDIEDKIRMKDSLGEFDNDFINLARSVYLNNDLRAKCKMAINTELRSPFREQKSYSDESVFTKN